MERYKQKMGSRLWFKLLGNKTAEKFYFCSEKRD